jgi:hypothetical protein
VRFDMQGDVTLGEGIAYLRGALAPIGYELVVDEEALRAAGVDFQKRYQPQLKAVKLQDIDRRFLRPAGVKMQRSGREVRLAPVEPTVERDGATP